MCILYGAIKIQIKFHIENATLLQSVKKKNHMHFKYLYNSIQYLTLQSLKLNLMCNWIFPFA